MNHDFDLEIQKINSDDIRRFVKKSLSKADPMFWEVPSSSTGKYHPQEDQGKGGLIRHIKKSVVVVEQFARRSQFSERELDMAIAAMLLHDICKNGIPWEENTDYTHGLIASKWLEQFGLEDRTAKEMILNAVRYHMAPWCYAVNPFEYREYSRDEMLQNMNELSRSLTNPSRIELAVREGDYWGSRQEMSFLPGKSIVYDPRLHDTPEKWLNEFAKDHELKVEKLRPNDA